MVGGIWIRRSKNRKFKKKYVNKQQKLSRLYGGDGAIMADRQGDEFAKSIFQICFYFLFIYIFKKKSSDPSLRCFPFAILLQF